MPPTHNPNSTKLTSNIKSSVICQSASFFRTRSIETPSTCPARRDVGCTRYLHATCDFVFHHHVASTPSAGTRQANDNPTLSFATSVRSTLGRRLRCAPHFRGCRIRCICSPHSVSAVNRHRSTANLSFHFRAMASLGSTQGPLFANRLSAADATPCPAHRSDHRPTCLARGGAWQGRIVPPTCHSPGHSPGHSPANAIEMVCMAALGGAARE